MSVVKLLLRNYKFCTDGKSHTVPVRRDCIIELPQGKVNTVEFVVLNEQVLGSRFTFGLVRLTVWTKPQNMLGTLKVKSFFL